MVCLGLALAALTVLYFLLYFLEVLLCIRWNVRQKAGLGMRPRTATPPCLVVRHHSAVSAWCPVEGMLRPTAQRGTLALVAQTNPGSATPTLARESDRLRLAPGGKQDTLRTLRTAAPDTATAQNLTVAPGPNRTHQSFHNRSTNNASIIPLTTASTANRAHLLPSAADETSTYFELLPLSLILGPESVLASTPPAPLFVFGPSSDCIVPPSDSKLQTSDRRPQTSDLRLQRTTRPIPSQHLLKPSARDQHLLIACRRRRNPKVDGHCLLDFHHARTILDRVSPASAPVTAMRQTSDSAPSRGLDGVCLSLSPPTHPHTHVPQPCRRPCSDFDSSPGHLRTRSATRKRRPMTDPSPATVRSWARRTGAQPTTAMGPEARPVRLTPLREQAG